MLAARSVQSAVDVLKKATNEVPSAAFILGSGVDVLETLDDCKTLSFADTFGVSPTVAGHSGNVTIGRLHNKLIAIFRGRFHLYEGHDWQTVTLPAQTIVEWGVPTLLLTNAAGGVNQNFEVGDLMVLTGYRDHLNPKWKQEGLLPAVKARPTSCANSLTEALLAAGKKLEEGGNFKPLRSGVYSGLLGPCYETMAEIEMLKRLQADAVGMSTVPELITAAGSKTQAAAISVITNVWRDDVPMGGHDEVLEACKAASIRLDKLFRAVLSEIN